jgi:hypothetical protein
MDGKPYGRASNISVCRSRKRLHCGGRIQGRHRPVVQKSGSGCVYEHSSAPVPGQHDKKRNRLLDKCSRSDRIQDLPQRNYLARMDYRNRRSGQLNNIDCLSVLKIWQSWNQEKELCKSLIRLMLSRNCFDSALLLSAQPKVRTLLPGCEAILVLVPLMVLVQ